MPSISANASRYAAATREHLVQVLELREPERAGEIGQAVVEAKTVVVEPVHVGRPALIALRVDALPQGGVRHRDHAPLAGGQLLVGVEAKHGGVAAGTHRYAVGVDGAERLAGVLDDRET